MIIGITGHTNIEKAAGLNQKLLKNGAEYQENSYEKVKNEILTVLHILCETYGVKFSDLTLVSGMARGVDEIFAIIAIEFNLKLILSVPGSVSWHKSRGFSRDMKAQANYYDEILEYSNIVAIVEVPKQYNGKTYQFVNFARNQNIIDESNVVISYKSYDSPGTDNAINLAMMAGKYFGNVPDIIKSKGGCFD